MQPRFSLKLLLLIMLIMSVMAAAGRHLVLALNPGAGRANFVLFTIAAPVLLLVATSLAYSLVHVIARFQSRRNSD